jgi:squalene synthase HpnC
MPRSSFADELAQFGPGRAGVKIPSLPEAKAYCRRLAGSHYENFTVASWLLPRPLRPHFCNLYAYCRWSDDLADETSGPAQSLELLDWWESQLRDCYRGMASHPVFVALGETIDAFSIPIDPLLELLVAFRQDQHVHRYQNSEELLDYCRYSANPVGRLVLYLGRSFDAERARLSDSICTGLQLANFWQDVARDWDRGRIYLPEDCLAKNGYTPEMFARRQYNPAFRRALEQQVEQAQNFLQAGAPLVERMPGRLRVDIALFVAGGLDILDAIRRLNYNVWAHRPTVSKSRQLWLLARCWWNPGWQRSGSRLTPCPN